MPKNIAFATYTIADISTKPVMAKDGELIGTPGAPGHLATLDSKSGDIFAIQLLEELHRTQMRQMQEFGFSAAFLRIIQALFKAHIPYARFDADAAEVEGLQEFSW